MQPKLQRRVQRYGWDLAAGDYEPLWRTQLASAQKELLAMARLAHGERVLDVACGTGIVTLDAARAVGADGHVLGVDLSGQMVDAGRRRADALGLSNVSFDRMDAERLEIPDASFDVALCSLGMMYAPEPEQAVHEMRRVLRPGGRMVIAVWGERSRCGWASVFEIVDAEVIGDVCPLFFRLGQRGALAQLCAGAMLSVTSECRIDATLFYADGNEACDAAFVGGPVAMAWSRFGDDVRLRARERYLESIAPWKDGESYRVPGEFVVVAAEVPGAPQA
ncbi:MAG TPA: methyltransferase domain-containing protein [Rudaea sp.]|nr:methyltransferase domain-containing protein [Rudaea sp.]